MRYIRVAFATLLAVMAGSGAVGGQAASPWLQESPWRVARGGYTWLSDTAAPAVDRAWAVGSAMVEFDGTSWRTPESREIPADFAAVDFPSPSRGYAVSPDGLIEYMGGGWLEHARSTPTVFSAIDSLPNGDLWGIGVSDVSGYSEIWRWHDDEWSREYVHGGGGRLLQIHMIGEADGWAVGDSGFTARYDGHNWMPHASVTDFPLNALAAEDGSQVWAGGGLGPVPGPNWTRVLLEFNGVEWRELRRDAGAAAIVDMEVSDGRGLAVDGSGGFLTLHDGSWSEMQDRLYLHRLAPVTSLSLVPGTDSALVSIADGRLLRVAEDGIVALNQLDTIRDIAFDGAGAGWAVGDNAAYDIDLGQVPSVSTSSVLSQAQSIDGSLTAGVWAGTRGGTVWHYLDGDWRTVAYTGTGIPLDVVRAVSPALAWVSGNVPVSGGSNVQYRSIVAVCADSLSLCRMVWDRTGEALDVVVRDLYATSAESGWVATRGGSLHEFRDDVWRQVDAPAGVTAISMGNVEWLGARGAVYRRDSGSWAHEFEFPAGAQVNRILEDPSGDVWVTAIYGLVARRHDGLWALVRGSADPALDSGIPRSLLGVAMEPDGGAVWAVGMESTIVYAPVDELVNRPYSPTPSPSAAATATATSTMSPAPHSTAYVPAAFSS